jgi:hypothetical protein
MTIRKFLLCGVLPLLSLTPVFAQPMTGAASAADPGADLPPGWPRPGATLLVENDRGAAYNVMYFEGKAAGFHRHRYFFAGLDLNTASVVGRRLGDKDWGQPGVVVKDRMWYLPKGLTHDEMTVTDPGRHTVVVDIKDKSVPEAANTTSFPSNKFAPTQDKVVDNDKVTIWDCAWSGRPGVVSFDTRDMFIAIAEGGDLSIAEDGKPAVVKHYDSGQAIFLPGGHARAITASNTAIHAMLVEVK